MKLYTTLNTNNTCTSDLNLTKSDQKSKPLKESDDNKVQIAECHKSYDMTSNIDNDNIIYDVRLFWRKNKLPTQDGNTYPTATLK